MSNEKQNDRLATPEGYIIKGIFYVVIGLVGKFLFESAKDRTESPSLGVISTATLDKCFVAASGVSRAPVWVRNPVVV